VINNEYFHQPVLLKETLAVLKPRAGGLYVDGTIGGAGHAEAVLLAAPNITLIGLDRDETALAAARARLAPFGKRVRLYHSNFSQIKQVISHLGYTEAAVDGVLLDIGVSSPQVDEAKRGFSYMKDGPLDMRMDNRLVLTAAMIVNNWEEADLKRLLYEKGEEKWAQRIAAFIIAERTIAPINTTFQLVSVIKKAIPKGAREKDQHPAKRSFMALRCQVNDEFNELGQGLQATIEVLKTGGRAAVISFHSLEDRIIKEKFNYWASTCVCPPELPLCVCGHKPKIKLINRKPIIAGAEEKEQNPRARSAKLRAAEKL